MCIGAGATSAPSTACRALFSAYGPESGVAGRPIWTVVSCWSADPVRGSRCWHWIHADRPRGRASGQWGWCDCARDGFTRFDGAVFSMGDGTAALFAYRFFRLIWGKSAATTGGPRPVSSGSAVCTGRVLITTNGVSTVVAAPSVTIGRIGAERRLSRTRSSEGRVGRRDATRWSGCGVIGRRAQNANDGASAAASGMVIRPGPDAFGARMRSRVSSVGPASGGWRTGVLRQILPATGPAARRQTIDAVADGRDTSGGEERKARAADR